VDLFLATADVGTAADAVEMLLTSVAAPDHQDFIEAIAGSGHDQAPALLDMLGRHHPDQTVARHARKLAIRCRNADRPS
jgi:hypothetical protein